MNTTQAGYTILSYIAFLDGRISTKESEIIRQYLDNNQHVFDIKKVSNLFTSKDLRILKKKLKSAFNEALKYFTANAQENHKKEIYQSMSEMILSDEGSNEQIDHFNKIADLWQYDKITVEESNSNTLIDDLSTFDIINEIASDYAKKFALVKGEKQSNKNIITFSIIATIIIIGIIILLVH